MTTIDDSPSPMSTEPSAPPSEGGRLGVFAAVLLGLAATLTAFAAYNASLKDGEVLEGYSTSSTALGEANYWYSQGNQTYAGDQAIFVQYAAYYETDPDLSDYLYEQFMRPELQDAIDWYQADPDASSPFEDNEANPYVVTEYDEADAENARSEAALQKAKKAGVAGDDYQLAAVLLALTLFFAGIATLFKRKLVSVSLLTIGLLMLLAGAGQLLAAGA